ncbi:hypothetical protein GCM10010124_40890 [Pilimelia terevasa]|uniref:AAA+ ATPase domain-containing protein n=1 Tax=Pilimelia terevasa TaxID=53372 RepID=A0A8J3BR70_9ACTN|nr:ATP-binding protein [Pilimelia terevasa]GGK43883.1 hypothetical protein GCM10010124_40890 [Pilimelia terevasa]
MNDDLCGWLTDHWRHAGQAVCLLCGAPGAGATTVARRAARGAGVPTAFVTVDDGGVGTDEALVDAEARLREAGVRVAADDPRDWFRAAMRRRCLLVLDGFGHLLDPSTGRPEGWFADAVRVLGRQREVRGRLLLTSHVAPQDGPWLGHVSRRSVGPLPPGAGAAYLGRLLRAAGYADAVPAHRRGEVVDRCAGSPRAVRLLVAALRRDPLDTLLGTVDDAGGGAARPGPAEPGADLEAALVRRALDRLDPAAAALCAALSVHRGPVDRAAVERLAPRVPRPGGAAARLRLAGLLDRVDGAYRLHPLARAAGRDRLAADPDLRADAHGYAADHLRRQRPGRADAALRHHLFHAGRSDDFAAAVRADRAAVLRTYRHRIRPPGDPASRAALTAALTVALADAPAGHAGPRVLLSRMLLDRGRPDDPRLALRHLTAATAESGEVEPWNLRIRLTARLSGPDEVAAALAAGTAAVAPPMRWQLYTTAGRALLGAGRPRAALAVLAHGGAALPAANRFGPVSMRAYILARQGRRAEAARVLATAYRELAPGNQAHRLMEEAVFLAAGCRDLDRLDALRALVVDDALADAQRLLCDVVRAQVAGRPDHAVALVAPGPTGIAVAGQLVFAHLARRDPRAAAAALDRARLPANRATTWWLSGLVALCLGAPARAADLLRRCAPRTPVGDAAALFLRVWDDVPDELGDYPAFYFPCLPAALTGLDTDLWRTPGDRAPLTTAAHAAALRLPGPGGAPPGVPEPGGTPGTGAGAWAVGVAAVGASVAAAALPHALRG